MDHHFQLIILVVYIIHKSQFYRLFSEICENKPYGYKSDVWSLGCVLYELATLKHPFLANNIKTLLTKILRGTYPPISPTYSLEMRDLLQDLFQREPKNRPSANAIIRRPFVFVRCRKFMSETMFTDFEKSVDPPPARQKRFSTISKRTVSTSKLPSNSPYLQSVQQSKSRTRPVRHGKPSPSSLDPERIRKAAIRSREAERKAIARRQKGLILKSQRSTGTTTESSSWMSSSAEDLTPRAISQSRIKQHSSDEEDIGGTPFRQRSISFDSSTITPRSSLFNPVDSEEENDVRSVESAIPLGAPVTGSGVLMNGKSRGHWRCDTNLLADISKMTPELTGSRMDQTATDDLKITMKNSPINPQQHRILNKTRVVFPNFQTFPTPIENSARSVTREHFVPEQFIENSECQTEVMVHTKQTPASNLCCHVECATNFQEPNDGQMVNGVLQNGYTTMLEGAIAMESDTKQNRTTGLERPLSARSQQANMLTAAIKKEVSAWMVNAELDDTEIPGNSWGSEVKHDSQHWTAERQVKIW